MVNIETPKELPDCELIKLLAEKVGQRHDTDFDFFGELDKFRKRISEEMRQVNALFPEYTPHDEQYHLKRLFHVVDTILGRERLEAMNSAELFVLAISLYGHDWGMGVSKQEKQYILTKKLPNGTKVEDFCILSDEQTRLEQLVHKHRLTVDTEGRLEKISIEIWREYVRETHAFRSRERVHRYFESIDGGVAMAASRVCLGHGINFEDLQDHNSYPPDFSVLSEAVNLRALAVYLRLVDLLDLAEDRTPYIIWKFVAPRDPHSKMDWAKHRALRPVTCSPYQDGRIIKVDGSTDNHEVYAALEDLRIYCEEQLRGCNDILARMNDARHKLDIYHIDWRVAAHGFKPVSVQFEFDREHMFKILSDEIYNGDSYVFLRELLQNSIDAIRMRREILKSNGIEPKDFGTIYVNVEHGDNGDATITWRDDGIGMDEYIIKNYLTVAGKSYYGSLDFERQGLKMDPISKFGVGILSCFVAAERIEIETLKEPYLPPKGERLRIKIPAIDRQFRIETLPQEVANVGTIVKVFIDGKKIQSDNESKSIKPLDVTGYLSIVAGFVEFPIVIIEDNQKTVVLHPKQDAEAVCQRFGKEFKVHQLDLSYSWSKAIYPQDLSNARDVLKEERWDISSDHGLEGYDGALSYLVPINNDVDLISQFDEIKILNKGKISPKELRSKHISHKMIDGLSRSSTHSITSAVYRDGILLSEASQPDLYSLLPNPQIVVNLPKMTSPRVDLARSKILTKSKHWYEPIFESHQNNILKGLLKGLLELDPAERLYQLGRLITFHNIEFKNIFRVLPHESWPLLFVEAGIINVLEWKDVKNEKLYSSPEYEFINHELRLIGGHKWLHQDDYNGFLVRWNGEKCIIINTNLVDYNEKVYISLNAIESMGRYFVNNLYHFGAIRFLHPPIGGFPPLLQKVWLRKDMSKENPEIEPLLEKIVENPALLNPEERKLLIHNRKYPVLSVIPEFIEFPNPFEQFFAYGTKMLNLKHPATQALLRFAASLALSKMRKTLPENRIGHLEDAIFSFSNKFNMGMGEDISDSLHKLWSLAQEEKSFEIGEIDNLVIRSEDFIPGTFDFRDSEDIIKKLEYPPRQFGMPL